MGNIEYIGILKGRRGSINTKGQIKLLVLKTDCVYQTKSFAVSCFYTIAAEQKARSTYEYLINLTDDPDVLAPLRFLREREVVHFQRFGEALDIVRDKMKSKDFCAFDASKDMTNGKVFKQI